MQMTLNFRKWIHSFCHFKVNRSSEMTNDFKFGLKEKKKYDEKLIDMRQRLKNV